jgi:type II secretory pathway pseudopilin PulG
MKQKVMTKVRIVMTNMCKTASSCEGITLMELLVAIIMGSIVLTAACSGFINLLKRNQDIESKTIRTAGLTKALAYIQEDMKSAKYVTAEKAEIDKNCNFSSVDSDYCLVLTYPDNSVLKLECNNHKAKIYYGFQDINKGEQIWLKPGILKRKVFCDDGNQRNWIVIADGLLSKNEDNPEINFNKNNDFCRQNSINWTGNLTVYGGNKKANNTGGFRFCLHNDDSANENSNNRLVRIFLYGHIIGGNPISLSTITFTRSE